MKYFTSIFLFLYVSLTSIGQTINDSIYQSWWTNKQNSIFEQVHTGQFTGTTTGYINLLNNKDTLVLDFQATNTVLKINKIEDPVYDDNTKMYLTHTTSGKTAIQYETFMLANVLTITLNGVQYSIGVFDGASDMPIKGLTYNYCHEKNIEYLTLFFTKPLKLTTSAYRFNYKNMTNQEARINEKSITILPGSTLIFNIKK